MAVITRVILFLVFTSTIVCAEVIKNFKILKFSRCNLTEPQLTIFNSTTFRMRGGRNKIILNGYGELTDDLIEPLQIIVTRTKCNIRSGECEPVNSLTVPNVCFLIMPQVFSFFGKFRPSITSCPVKKGLYVVDNVELDMSFFVNLPMNGLRYQTQLMIRTNGRVGFCSETHWTMTNARSTSA